MRACIDQGAALRILPASLPEHWVPPTEHERFPHISCWLHPTHALSPLMDGWGVYIFAGHSRFFLSHLRGPCLLYSKTSMSAGPVASSLPFRYPLWMDMM